MSTAERESAERLLESGRYGRAVERFRAILAEQPDDPALRGRLAEAYRRAGNLDRAFHHFDRAAQAMVALGQDQEAAELLARADEVVPGEPEILFRRAKILERLGQAEPLETTCERLILAAGSVGDRRREWALERLEASRPHDPQPSLRRARFLTEAGRPRDAASAYREVVIRSEAPLPAELFQELTAAAAAHPEMGLPLAEAALTAGEPRAAVAHLAPLHRHDPADVESLQLVVRALEQLNANEQLRAARVELIKALTGAGRRSEAIELIRSCLTAAPRDREMVEVCALALNALDRPVASAKLWSRLVELHHETGDEAERDRAILRLLRLAPNDISALTVASRVLTAAGRGEEARALRERIAALEATSTPAAPPAPDPAPSPTRAPARAAEPAPARAAETAPARAAEPPRSPVYGRGLITGSLPPARAEEDPEDTLDEGSGDLPETSDLHLERCPAPAHAASLPRDPDGFAEEHTETPARSILEAGRAPSARAPDARSRATRPEDTREGGP